jgi:hypothetical protein
MARLHCDLGPEHRGKNPTIDSDDKPAIADRNSSPIKSINFIKNSSGSIASDSM